MSRRESGTSTWPFLLGLIALLALMAALTLLPIGWKMNRFVVWLYYDGLHLYASPLTAWLYFDQSSFLLNVLLTVPIGLLARFAFPRLAWWVVGLAVLVLSGCVEVAQLVLPLGRWAAGWNPDRLIFMFQAALLVSYQSCSASFGVRY